MTRYLAWIATGLFAVLHGATVHAQAVTAPVGSPVDHPLVAAHPVRTAGAWRQGVGRFGESLASGSLRLRGYEVIDMKLPGNRGIDLVAVKRTATGTVGDIRLIEVKTHYGSRIPHLGQTLAGTQMSRLWLVDRLRSLRNSGEEGRRLALEISRFRRAEGIPLERLGEVHDVNLRTGKYTIRNPISMAERAGPMSIERLLNRVSGHSTQPASQMWAMRHLSQFDQLRQARMGNWLSGSSATRALNRASSTRIALLLEKQALRGSGRALARAAGPIGLAAAVTVDAYEIYGHVREYRLGNVSQRELIVAVARSSGGVAGAWAGWWAGSSAGAWAGAQLGLLGGPYAVGSVPIGAGLGWFIGGGVGGFAGYIGGSYVGEFTAQAWYGSLDRNVRERVSGWLKNTPNPVGN